MAKTDKKVKVTGVEVRTYKDYNFSGSKKTQEYKFVMMLALIKHNKNVSVACRLEDVCHPATHFFWLLDDPQYKAACEVAKAVQNSFIESALMSKVEEGDVPCIIAAAKMYNIAGDNKPKIELNIRLDHLGLE